MKIGQYIQDKWLERLGRTGVLVVYDPARRYRDLCLALRADKREVVDASESSIESREAGDSDQRRGLADRLRAGGAAAER
jgi:hypothetical protein